MDGNSKRVTKQSTTVGTRNVYKVWSEGNRAVFLQAMTHPCHQTPAAAVDNLDF